ncbi:PepSY domain-containing protein [Solimonas sp. K1W22B-7]|uniref:PepSY-associated TM helix domain-containing protein n=1 Tax=Solimonas sp. K1W22B-7 TaxID=2303331 RepID=UPI000E330510|nr:PepSY-associated TM helix domain-containing protein [Solimonas sp. K1W22B-7]AXQ29355.1 PepSY domain-containing protein [Solimonas sp. K1W22B-7]
MKQGFRQSMAWLHTWGGLLFAWLLFAVFFAGTLSFYREELTLWMQPELHEAQPGSDQGVAAALSILQQRAPGARSWTISLPGPRDPVTEARWSKGKFDRKAVVVLDPATGRALEPRDTAGGSFFRNFHFSLLLKRTGYWIVGVATLMMMVALVTGVVIHKKIFKDFFTFRPGKSKPRAWLDAHNVSGVMALPFFLVISYSGLLTLAYVFMPAGMIAAGVDSERFLGEISPREDPPEAAGSPAALAAIAPMLEQAREHWPDAAPGSVTIHHPGDAAAVVDVWRRRGTGITARIEPVLRFDGASGRLLREYDQDAPAAVTYGAMYGLHVAWFAQPFLRALLFAMGAMGCLVIASGAVIWGAKRREQHGAAYAAAGYRAVEALNVAGIAGMAVATAALLWSNRLLPVELLDRPLAEKQCFFGAWLLCLAHALLRPRIAAWREQLWLAAALLALLPLLTGFTDGLSLPRALWQGRWPIAGVELAALGFAALLGWAGHRIGAVRAAPGRRRASRLQSPVVESAP